MSLALAAYLDLVRSNYPFGLPCSLIKRGENRRSSEAPASGILVVVGDFGLARAREQFMATPAGELLSAALIKGLKLTPQQFTIIDVMELRDREATADLPRVLLAFGEQAARAVAELIARDERLHNTRVITSLELDLVVQDPQRKRELWRDIQGVTTY